MRQNEKLVQSWIGLSEGGYVNNKQDNGGPTNRGITQRTFSAWLKLKKLPDRDVKTITKAEAERIISEQYLVPIRFDELPSGLDYAVADYSVNSGPSRPIKALQWLVGVKQDGVLGVQTLAKIKESDVEDLIRDLIDERMAFLRRLSDWKYFGEGWEKRILGKVDGQQDDDIGVLDRAIRMHRQDPSVAANEPAIMPKQGGAKTIDKPNYGLIASIIRAVLQLFGGKNGE